MLQIKDKILQLFSYLQLLILKKVLQSENSEERTYFVLTLATGVASALVAVSIHKITYFSTKVMGTNTSFGIKAFLLGGVCVLLSGYITKKIPFTSGSGIPQVRLSLAMLHGRIPFLSTVAKYFATILSLSSGMSLGREGPTASICAGIGSSLGKVFNMPKRRIKALVAVGSAGGIAAAFSTPISAVVFTLEEIVGDLNAKMLGAIIISAVIASITTQMLTGTDSAFFSSLDYKLGDPREILLYLAVGLAAAFIGPLWVKSVLKMRSFNLSTFKNHTRSVMFVTFLLMGAISLFRPEALGSGHSTLSEAVLSLIIDWKVLLSIFVLKFFATTLSYASGISGGLFMPTLLIGAMLGGLVGNIANIFFPGLQVNIGVYALVGMGAFFASVIRAPFTSILMVFELVHDYNIVLPLMVANSVSYFISSRIRKGSIYESISEQDGVHLPTRDDNEVLDTMVIEDAMETRLVTLNGQMTINEAFEQIKKLPFTTYPVIKSGSLSGMVSLNNIIAMRSTDNGDRPVIEATEKKFISCYPDQSLLLALHLMKKFTLSHIPIVSRANDKKIVGILTAQDIISTFGYHIKDEDDDSKSKIH